MPAINTPATHPAAGVPGRIGWFRRARYWLWRTLQLIAACLAVYAIFLLAGFIPMHLDYQVPPVDDRVEIFVGGNDIHTDLVLPIVDEATNTDWRRLFPQEHFGVDLSPASHVSIGWGDRGFYLETPRWSDLKLTTLAQAMFVPSPSVVHVEYLDAASAAAGKRVWISRKQYRELVAFVLATLGPRDAAGRAEIASPIQYGPADRFYTSPGSYHLFNTCNQWTGRGLATAGVTVGIWTPSKTHVMYWLPPSE